MLDGLGALVQGRVRLWRYDGRALRPVGGGDPGWSPSVPREPGPVPTPTGSVWLAPVRAVDGFWVEVDAGDEERSRSAADRVVPIVEAVLETERQRGLMAEELASRYQEIDLLYAISEILGTTVRLEEATHTIVREVSTVVGAQAGLDHGSGRRRGRVADRGGARVRRRRPRAGAGGRRLLRGREGVSRTAHHRLRPRRIGGRAGRLRR